jgi:hypothetical protein
VREILRDVRPLIVAKLLMIKAGVVQWQNVSFIERDFIVPFIK